jgi:hypothetical protein
MKPRPPSGARSKAPADNWRSFIGLRMANSLPSAGPSKPAASGAAYRIVLHGPAIAAQLIA